MEIVFDKKDSVNALVRIKLDKADYQPKVDKTLKDFAKKAAIKGFRPGKVPMQVVQKMYGKDTKVQEVNEVSKDSLFNYLKENQIDILASPLVSMETAQNFNWNNDDFEFIYEIALKPVIAINLAEAEVPFYNTTVGNEEVDLLATRLGEIYAEFTQYEEVAAGHTVFGLFKYGKDTSRFAHLKVNELVSETATALIGKKKSEDVELDLKKLYDNDQKLADAFHITVEEVAAIEGVGMFTIRESFVSVPPVLNEVFYDKVFGEAKVNSEEEYKAKLTEVLEKKYSIEVKGIAVTYFREYLLKNVDVTLPDAFLKKWLQSTANRQIENLEAEYLGLQEGVKYDLILNQLAKENGISPITNDDLLNKVKDTYFLEFFYSRPVFMEGLTDYFAYQFLQSKDNQAMIDNLKGAVLAERVLDAVKSQVKANDITTNGMDFEKRELRKVEDAIAAA